MNSFEVQLGIIAACTPAMRPGYKWVKDKIKGYHTSKGHTQLTDEIRLRPVDNAMTSSTTKVQPTYGDRSHAIDEEYGFTSADIKR